LLGAHGRRTRATTTCFTAIPALLRSRCAPRLLVTRPHRLYVNLAVRREYSSSCRSGSTSTMPYAAMTSFSGRTTTLTTISTSSRERLSRHQQLVRIHLQLVDFSSNRRGSITDRHGFVDNWVPRTKPTCLLHTWRPHRRRSFALDLHMHQHQSSRNLHLQYSTKNQSTQHCQSLITQGSDHPSVLEPHMVLTSSPRASAGVPVRVPQTLEPADGTFFPPGCQCLSVGPHQRTRGSSPRSLAGA
jgi:hypothetical protein